MELPAQDGEGAVSMLALLAPRLRYRLRYGIWCDHQDKPWSSQFLFMDGPTGGIDLGFDQGRLIDMGRRKLFTCQRCGHTESNLGHPVRERLRRWARKLFVGSSSSVGSDIILAAMCLLVGMAVALISLAVSH
ncbi:MAG TPA: hypothetical protein VGH72_33745 [Pseudonocardia sp.]